MDLKIAEQYIAEDKFEKMYIVVFENLTLEEIENLEDQYINMFFFKDIKRVLISNKKELKKGDDAVFIVFKQ